MVVEYQILRGCLVADYYAGGYRLCRFSYNLKTKQLKFRSDPHRPFVVPGMVFFRLTLRFKRLVRQITTKPYLIEKI